MKKAVASDGAELAWTEEGQGEPLLLVAGQATGISGWDPVVPGLAPSFRVIRFDHRGIGASTEGRPENYTTRAFAADAVAVLDAAGVAKAHIYGHSMGGRVAQRMAVDFPVRVASLVLAATSAGEAGGVGRDPSATAALISTDPARMAPLFFSPAWARENPAAVAAFFRVQASATVKSRHFRASRLHDAWDVLPSIQAPALIIHGNEDALSPVANAVMMAERIPDSRLIQVDGGRHGLHLDDARVQTWIEDFLALAVPAGAAH
ncbi:alpha/beta hydrolase [Arthrobacter globiformis]|uniref:Alpha/beta hydrolase n=1 Tax=Arthrobacter globiformis TaxID=1665 RepID=A0A328HKF5_ARTGO|nr:alpha/beta hydrolase [Arthrobacter globiformis]